jgi:hypothetical protein
VERVRRAPAAPIGTGRSEPQQGGDGRQPVPSADRRAEASERRSQAQNRAEALFRLRVNLALEIRRPLGGDESRRMEAGRVLARPHAADPVPLCGDCAPSPSVLWQSRCGGGVLKVSATHDDFPAFLAEALDVLAAVDADPKHAAAALGCTPSQLVRFLRLDPRALALVNRWRRDRRMHALR